MNSKRASDVKHLAIFTLLTFHSTTMCHAFQMAEAVDKQKRQEIFHASAEFLRFDLGSPRVQEHFPFVWSQRERKDVRRFVFPAVGPVERPRAFFADEDQTQFVISRHYLLFH